MKPKTTLLTLSALACLTAGYFLLEKFKPRSEAAVGSSRPVPIETPEVLEKPSTVPAGQEQSLTADMGVPGEDKVDEGALNAFGQKISILLEDALTDKGKAERLFPELQNCVQSNYNSAVRETCLIGARRLSDAFPQSFEKSYEQLLKAMPQN